MKYKFTFRTGNIKGAGTDSKISVKLFGSKLNTGELTLSSQFSNFERDKIDVFFAETEDLGEINKIQIWHNDRFPGADWYLDDIIIESNQSSKIWYFPVFRWITKNTTINVSSTKYSTYHFEITTGNLPGSGSGDTILISLIGSKSYTHFFSINKFLEYKEFKTGHTVSFRAIFEDIGKITSIHVKSLGNSINSNWFLSKITLKKDAEKDLSVFPFHNWVFPNKVFTSNKDLFEYTIKFYTGDVTNGGTDANVKMIIHGTENTTDTIELNALIARNAFESGNTDYIKLAANKLGEIIKITIWHDEKWIGDGWFLNKITIHCNRTGLTAEFPYYSWLDKSADPKSTRVELLSVPINPRPFYVIAHMVNTPSYVEEALDLGSNAIEFDITPSLSNENEFAFDVFHGFRPDFDPDKINLMERSLARTSLELFLTNLRFYANKYPAFSLMIFDCKLDQISKKNLANCGKELVKKVITNFYTSHNDLKVYTIFSVPRKKFGPFFDGIENEIPKKLHPFIGFDFSMEKFQSTERIFEKRNGGNFWWGSGIASTVPKPLKHFIPQFLIAANKRAKREIIKKIYYWTLDDPDSMARILLTKLDGIIVNDPLKLLRVLHKEEFRHSYRLASRRDNPFAAI